MSRRNLSHRNLMFMSASALILCAVTPAVALAQTAAPATAATTTDTVEEVVVTGQRAALQSAQKLKQNAAQLVDSITATDIGALPDRSVTEALQRVSGVTIGRTADGRDADRLSVEGSGVQIRGLSYVRGELNGRDNFSAKSGRTLSFEDVPPELMAGVDVYKNPSADIVEGGLGGTVNLRTRMPFDAAGPQMAYSLDESYGDLSKKWKPSGSVLLSDRWDTKWGEFGALIDLSDSQLESRADTISVDPYYARTDLVPGKTVYVPGGYGYRSLDLGRERKGIAAALQWRPNDQWEVSSQFLRSSANQSASEHAVGFNPGATNGPAAGTSFTYDDAGRFLTGTISDKADGTGTTLGNSLLDARYNERSSVTSDYSLTAKFNPNDKWSFSADLQYVYAKTKTVDFTAFNAFNATTPAATLDLTGKAPVITMNTDTSVTSDPANYTLLAAMDHHDRNDANEWAERFDGSYTFDEGGWLKAFRFGVRHTAREATTRETNYNWGYVGSAAVNTVPSLQGYESLYTFDNYFRGKVHLPATFIQPTASLVNNFAKGSAIISGISNGWVPFSGDYSTQTAGGANGGVNQQSEKTLAAYGLLSFDHDVSLWGEERGFDGNFGLRVVQTKSHGEGFETFQVNTGGGVYPADDVAFANGARTAISGGRTYVNVLPSLNTRLKITPDLFLRFAAAKSIVRPDFNQLQPIFNITQNGGIVSGGVCTALGSVPASSANCVYSYSANAGNPDLKPTRSTQFDLAMEWYFAPTGSLTGTVFAKDLYNYITNGPTRVSFTNNGVTRDAILTQSINAGHGTIRGFEVAYQQYFDFLPGWTRGFGTQANFTFIDSKGARNAAANAYDSTQTTAVTDISLPLEGMSKYSYNIAALYDLGPVSARVAYNWRKEYLLTSSAANINLPAWAGDYGQLDASLFYTVNKSLKIGVQGVNLLNERTKILVSYPGRPEEGKTIHNWVESDRRFSVVLRGTF